MMNLKQKVTDGTAQRKDLSVVDFYKQILKEQPFAAESLAKKPVSLVLNTRKTCRADDLS